MQALTLKGQAIPGWAGLRAQFKGEVRESAHDRLLYSTDASLYQIEPLAVAIPADASDVEAAVRFCARNGVPLLARGGGTSLAGQCTNRALVLDLTPRMRSIRRIDAASGSCEVEAGISPEALNGVLGAHGLFFAPDPATVAQCAIGGCIGNNAAGARSIRYGRTSENLLGVEVVLAGVERGEEARRLWLEPGAGRRDPAALRLASEVARIVSSRADLVRRRFPKTVRRNAGYGLDLVLAQLDRGVVPEDLDLSGLLCGSEGTLAVTLAARLKLHPIPRARALAVVSFVSVDRALDALLPILATGPTAVELLDDVVLDAARGNIECRGYTSVIPDVDGRPAGAALYVEYASASAAGTEEEIGARMESLRRVVAGAPMRVTDAADAARAWKLRKAGEPLLHGLAGPRKPVTFIEDNAVPPERLGEFVRRLRAIVTRHGTRAAYWAHASVGVLHVRPLIDLHDERDREVFRRIAVEAADLAKELGGVMSGEHGDGRVRGPLLERFFGTELMAAFGAIKRLFDPLGVLNPGNIVGAGPEASITDHFRIDAEREDVGARVETYFAYEDHHGFLGAVEACNGAGVCRKTSGGAMCPSYRGTLDERHATRGRGNALRLAVTGQLGRAGELRWSDPETIATLDLCLSCKACKSECPSNVDIARLKAEYTAQRYRAEGRVPLAARAIGHVRTLNRLGSMTPALANWISGMRGAGWLAERLLGIDRRRALPTFERSLYAWWARRGGGVPSAGAAGPRVVLFADCFTAYNEPSVGMAAVRVLEHLGCRVELAPAERWGAGCCGRAMISTGMLAQAIETADATIAMLRPAIEDPSVSAILVCEPSCLSAFKDDWLQLRVRSALELRRALAEKAQLVETFVAGRMERSGAATPTTGGPVLLHGHCHQKALWGVETSARALRAVAGDRLRVLDTGCCGMAGAFGYAADKYDLSMRIAELSVAPMIRDAPRSATIVAPGTSCRHQIRDATGRRALHPVECLATELMAAPTS
ncbi:MAG: FAD-binding protein [Phycisphaerae bacterium]|nr:FAD-binding protein [Phycisphaerae bacterium]